MAVYPLLSPALAAALAETFDAASSLLPAPLRSEFVLVSRAALARWGRGRRTEDVDIACSKESMLEFRGALEHDPRFSVDPDRELGV